MEPYVTPDDREKLWLRTIHKHLATEFPEPVVAYLRTRDTAKTQPAGTTQAAIDNPRNGLNVLFHGQKIWDRAWSYISEAPFAPHKHGPVLPNLLHAWHCPNTPNDAPTSYRNGLALLRSIISTNETRPTPILTNNTSAKDVLDKYVYDAIEAALQVSDTS